MQSETRCSFSDLSFKSEIADKAAELPLEGIAIPGDVSAAYAVLYPTQKKIGEVIRLEKESEDCTRTHRCCVS